MGSRNRAYKIRPLSFTEEARAREAGARLDRRGFDVRGVSPDLDAERWSVHAIKDVAGPVISRGFGLTELRLGWLARRLGGQYEGHELPSRARRAG